MFSFWLSCKQLTKSTHLLSFMTYLQDNLPGMHTSFKMPFMLKLLLTDILGRLF